MVSCAWLLENLNNKKPSPTDYPLCKAKMFEDTNIIAGLFMFFNYFFTRKEGKFDAAGVDGEGGGPNALG